MSDFTTKPVKINESDFNNSQQKLNYETISKLCNFFTADEPSTYLAYLHYNKDLLTEEEIAECKERYEIVLHNRNVKNKIVNERFLNKNDETFCEEECLTDICCNENMVDVSLNEITE